jgi:hypothetical protein
MACSTLFSDTVPLDLSQVSFWPLTLATVQRGGDLAATRGGGHRVSLVAVLFEQRRAVAHAARDRRLRTRHWRHARGRNRRRRERLGRGCITNMLANLPNVQVVVPMSASTEVSPSSSLKSILFVVGIDDKVIGYDSVQIGNGVCPANPNSSVSNVAAYAAAAGSPQMKKRLVRGDAGESARHRRLSSLAVTGFLAWLRLRLHLLDHRPRVGAAPELAVAEQLDEFLERVGVVRRDQ